jgi:hypothetical protein
VTIMMKVDVSITIPSAAILDTIVSGAQRGIQGWGNVATFWIPARGGLTDEPGADLHLVCDVVERATGNRIPLKGRWRDALCLMAERYPCRFADLIASRADHTTGNVLIQLAAFGEVRYG